MDDRIEAVARDVLREIGNEQEADVFYGAVSALARVEGPYPNFVLPTRRGIAASWVNDPPDMVPQPYYTVKRDPVGWWQLDDGSRHAVLQVMYGREVTMLIVPALERILVKTPTKAE